MNTLKPKNAVKSVAAEQIKRACQNYWGPPAPLLPGPSLCYGTAHSGVTTSKPNLSLVHNLWLLFTFQITLRRGGAIG